MNVIVKIIKIGCCTTFLFLSSCFGNNKSKEVKPDELEIGGLLPRDCVILKDSNYMVLTSPGNLTFGKRVLFRNSEYSLTFDIDNKINFISTNDPSVEICDGFNTGMKYGDISDSSKISSYDLPGWAFVVTIKNCDWKLGFVLDKNDSITDTSKVAFIFKT